ncbi:MAG: nicotinate phosphoribosyltransferase [Weeksellaceae bacterium]|nr:nicotinate phosphoribosyltransferase [Weeksellaceae bacterium]
MAIFHSILDNDFYKFTMQNAVTQLFPNTKARYAFINRGEHDFPSGFADALQQEVLAMQDLALSRAEKDFLKKRCPYLSPVYLDFLEGYRYDASEVQIEQNGNNISVTVEGYWYRTILWEVPLLALISELFYTQHQLTPWTDEQITANTLSKLQLYQDLQVPVAEFGTRRRHSLHTHNLVVKTLKENNEGSFIGSSNVHMAMKYDTRPIGTHAHEWFMFHAAEYGFKMSNAVALENWVKIYRGDLGVALSDTYTTEVFFRQFDKKFAKLFDGVRHDSGDPVEFAHKTIAHYKSLGINPLYKFIIFSDGLNSAKVADITEQCRGKIGISFGIGTNLTNDVGLKPMNIVLKLMQVQTTDGGWEHVVKLSDEPKKHTGTPEMIALAQQVLKT